MTVDPHLHEIGDALESSIRNRQHRNRMRGAFGAAVLGVASLAVIPSTSLFDSPPSVIDAADGGQPIAGPTPEQAVTTTAPLPLEQPTTTGPSETDPVPGDEVPLTAPPVPPSDSNPVSPDQPPATAAPSTASAPATTEARPTSPTTGPPSVPSTAGAPSTPPPSPGSSDSAPSTTVAPPTLAGPSGTGTGLLGEYFTDPNLEAFLFARVDAYVHFDWFEVSPEVGVPNDGFSVRWTGEIEPKHVGGTRDYEFFMRVDDGARVWVDGVLLIDEWSAGGRRTVSGTVPLTAGERYDIKVEYFENTGSSFLRLEWQPDGMPRETLPQVFTYPN